MQSSSTVLYHDHILTNIDQLDKRKDTFIGFRLDFLHEFCVPVRHKIDAIKEDIKYYEHLRDTAYQFIQSQSDIILLKNQIADYKKTNKYFENKVDQFDQSIAQLEVYLQQRRKALEQKKSSVRIKFNDNELNFKKYQSRLHQIPKGSLNDMKSISTTSRLEDSIIHEKSLQRQQRQLPPEKQSLLNSRSRINSEVVKKTQNQQKIRLPSIENKKQQKYYIWSKQDKLYRQHERNQIRLQKIIQKSQKNSIINQNPESLGNQIDYIKQTISQFDYTEQLFRECFERKKISIQKSVSQLQPRLINNKELFLKVCQVIGQKQGKISFQQFSNLTTDEIVTLFISYSWLSRKIYNQLGEKRKNLTRLLKQIKDSQNSN